MSKRDHSEEAAPVDTQARCGLCGKTGKLTRTPCCGNWICDDADQYMPFSYARNSCFRNHTMFTICGFHGSRQHEGRWQDCAKCRENGPLEMYVESATNEYNFEKLDNPPKFEPTHCSGCGVVIRLSKDSYSMRDGGFWCEACDTKQSGTSVHQFLAQLSPSPSSTNPMENVPVKITGKRGHYPIASMAYYGPDNMLATKLVVSIFKSAEDDSGLLHRWITQAGDIRKDAAISAEVETFLKTHGVQQRIVTERIIGCPHEEGKDYPMGGVCPHCPFWHNRDRATHELLPPPPEMTPAQILAELAATKDRQPRAALLAADANRAALVEPLLLAVERGLANPHDDPENEDMLFSFASYLLAKWRETRVYPLFIRWLSLPDEGAFDLGGDTVTQDGGRLLASVCGGNLDPIKALILNRDANEYCRGQAVESLAVLAAWQEAPHQEVTDYFTWLAREGLERENSHVWDCLAAACADIEALGAFAELRRAYAEGLILPGFMQPKELDDVEKEPRGKSLARYRERHPPITDVAHEIGWWQCFQDDPVLKAKRSESRSLLEPFLPASAVTAPQPSLPAPPRLAPEPFRAPPKVGRNDPCPCGSGKKYKKCCGK